MARIHSIYTYQAFGIVLALAVIVVAGWAMFSGLAESSLPQTIIVKNAPGSESITASPLDIFNSHKPPLTELSKWAVAWEANVATSRPSDPAELARLAELIDKSGLNAREQLAVGKYVLAHSDQDTAAVWFRRGINQTAIELNTAKQTAGIDNQESAEVVLRPLLPALDVANDLLGTQRFEDEPTLERLLSMEMLLKRTNQWDQRPEWVRIAHTETLFSQQYFAKALVEIGQLEHAASHDPRYTTDEKSEIHWNRAMILYQLKNYDDALPELRTVVSQANFGHAKDAWALLIETLCELHRGSDAEAALNQYRQRYQISDSAVASISGLVDDAKYNEQWEKLHAAPYRNN